MAPMNSTPWHVRTALDAAPLLALCVACSPVANRKPNLQLTPTAPAAAAATESGKAPASPGAPQAPSLGLVDSTSSPPTSSPTTEAACSSSRAQAERIQKPVDIIVVLDNSLSMSDEAQSVEANLNVNLAQILASSGVDYRVILISQHRSSDNDLQRTSVCITRPLSGLDVCPAPQPVFGERFFQYSVDVGSHDSLSLLLDSYDGTKADDFGLAPHGWSEWLRADASKTFLEITDDDSHLSAASFMSQLTALGPDQFGTDGAQPGLVWHSIIGLAEKAAPDVPYLPLEPVQTSRCSGSSVFSSGPAYQDLSRLTGGLRFPICEFGGYDRVFQAVATDVAASSGIACGFAIPSPPTGQRLELDKVAVSYTPGDGTGTRTLGQVSDQSSCGDDAFLIAGGAINLCPQACAKVSRDALATVEVVFSCASTLILR